MKAIYMHPDGMGELLFDAAISRLFFFSASGDKPRTQNSKLIYELSSPRQRG